jgi:hypothetical protein
MGFTYQVPAWNDYNQDKHTVFWYGEKSDDINSITGKPHIRRPYIEVVAEQRENGAKAIWAHPTSWWKQDGTFITNIAAEMVAQYHADGFLDGMTVMGYDPYHKDYQNLWFYLLDKGCFAPAYAELDASFVSTTYYKHPALLSAYHAEYKETETMIPTCVTNGPLVEILNNIDNIITVNLLPQQEQTYVSLLEILGEGGQPIISLKNVEAGSYRFSVDKSKHNYLVARVWGENDSLEMNQQDVKFHAISNPLFLKEFKRCQPLLTDVDITVKSENINTQKTPIILNPLGNIIGKSKFINNKIEGIFPANSNIRIEDNQGKLLDIPIMMANPKLREQMDYLANGKFLNDCPNMQEGQVPAEAFRFEEIKQAMQSLKITI